MQHPCKTCEIKQYCTTMSQVTNCEKFRLYQEYFKNLKEIERMDILGKTEDTMNKFTWMERCYLVGLLGNELKKEKVGTSSYNWLQSLIDKVEIMGSEQK